MPLYHRLGQIPPKRHQVFRRKDGGMHFEQLMGNKGFVGPSSLLYHLRYPTELVAVEAMGSRRIEEAPEPELRHRHGH